MQELVVENQLYSITYPKDYRRDHATSASLLLGQWSQGEESVGKIVKD